MSQRVYKSYVCKNYRIFAEYEMVDLYLAEHYDVITPPGVPPISSNLTFQETLFIRGDIWKSNGDLFPSHMDVDKQIDRLRLEAQKEKRAELFTSILAMEKKIQKLT